MIRRGWAAVLRIPHAGRVCFVIALLNAAIWGIVVPPFQVPDEITHFGYAQYLAQTGKPPPQGAGSQYSPQENVALDKLFFESVVGNPQLRGILTSPEQEALRQALARHPSPLGGGGASSATNQPPLYYALEAVPYWIFPSHDILSRLVLMRLLSALIAACTVLVVYLFLRELFPSSPWAWTVGALMVAFQPMVNFIAAGVQGDNLLYLTSALTFLLMLRSYRRGFTRRRALALGATVAAGVLAKLTFVALIPGIGLGVLLLGWRELPRGRRHAAQSTALAVLVAALPVVLYAILNVTVWDRGSAAAGGLTVATARGVPGGGAITLHETLDYIWQAYLPRLPFMHRQFFPGGYSLWHVWLNGAIGRFGWLDYGFPAWVYTLGRYLLFAFFALALIGAYRLRSFIKPLLPLFTCYAVMAVGLLGAIGYAGVRYWLTTGYRFEQARYLFPLLALYGAFAVLVAKGAGRRWAPVLGAALVLLAMAHGLFAEALTISRYYG